MLKKIKIQTSSEFLSAIFILFPISLFMLGVGVNILGINVSAFIFWFSLLLIYSLVCWLSSPFQNNTKIAKNIALSLAVLVGSIAFAYYFQDFTFDARFYHLPGSISIAEGWNPIWDSQGNTLPRHEDVWRLAILYYPKAQWYINAISLLAFDSIEVGKFNHIPFIIASYLVAKDSLQHYFKTRANFSYFIAFIIAINPIAIMQIGINNIDGLMASGLMIIVFCLLNPKVINIILAVAITVFLINIKFTGLIISCFIWLVFIIIYFFKNKEIVRCVFFSSIISVVLGLIMGFNPYISNVINKGHPLYPYYSGNKVDKPYELSREYFENVSRLERFAVSYSSAPSFIRGNEKSVGEIWRSPFEYKHLYKYHLVEPMARTLAGFGIFYGLVLILTLTLYLFSDFTIGAVLIMLWVTAFITPEGWHARYFPHLWLIPIWVISAGYFVSNRLFVKIIAFVFSLLLLAGSLLLFANYPQPRFFKGMDYFENIAAYKSVKGKIDMDIILNRKDSVAFKYIETKRAEAVGFEIDDTPLSKSLSLFEFINKNINNLIIISVKGDFVKRLTMEEKRLAREYGMEWALNSHSRPYIAILDAGELVEELVSLDRVYTEYQSQGLNILVDSQGYGNGTRSSIKINGSEYSPNKLGINIIAIEDHKLVSIAYYDTSENPEEDLKQVMYSAVK